MKRLLIFLTVVTLVSCGRSFEKRTAKYAEVGEMSDNRAAVLDINEGVGRWGYVDGTGRLAIECRYADARRFADGLAAVQVPEGAWGYIDTVGRLVIAPQFVLAEPFEDGMAWVQAAGELWGRVDKSGKMVIPCLYSEIGEPDERGWMRVLRDEPYGGQWGLIDTLGRETIPCRYYYLDTPGEGLAAFMLEQFGNYGYVDVKGNVAITPRFAVARPFSGGVAVVSYNNVNYGLVDRNGNEVSSFRYKRIGEFHDGLAPFNTNLYGMNFQGMEPRCGYIDTEGREVLPAKWDDAGEFSEMRAPVMRFGVNSEDFYDARWGYIATNGQLVVPFKYHEAYPFSCGLARVFVKGLGYGYINRKGEEVVPCKYQEAEDFHDFTAKVKQYDRVMTIDDKGQIVEGQ